MAADGEKYLFLPFLYFPHLHVRSSLSLTGWVRLQLFSITTRWLGNL